MKTIPFDFDTIGGVARVYAIPVDSFVAVVNDFDNDKKTLQLSETDNVIEIPTYADESFEFSENQSREDGGELYEVTIRGVIPKQEKLGEKIVKILERGEWLVLHQDAAGIIRLSGTKFVPLRFMSSRLSGKNYSDLNGNEFVFTANEQHPSVIVDFDFY